MEIINFKSHEELAELMVSVAHNDKQWVGAILFYEDAVKLLHEIMMYQDIHISSIQIEDNEIGYNGEYLIDLDHCMNLSVNYVLDDSGTKYNDFNVDVALLDGDANSKIIKHLNAVHFAEISIGRSNGDYSDNDECDCDDCCECCESHDSELADYCLENAMKFMDIYNFIVKHRK